jgi:DNA mismatch endonuclease (patch repair protein)
MSSIHSSNTKPELIVRKYLWKLGFRYRINLKRLPGHPDIVLRKYRTCIFVNGCFWHGHKCPEYREPKSNILFWQSKIARNQERDKNEHRMLAKMGWHVIVVWECELKPGKRENTLKSLAYTLNHIYLQDHSIKYKHIDEDVEIAAEPINIE